LLFYYANAALIIFTLLLNFSGVLYTIFFKSITQVILCFKNFFVALVWASWGPFSLLFFYSLSISRFFILVFLFLWSQFFLNSIFFDLKDIESDRERGLKTLPVTCGNEPTLKFLYIANILGFIPIIIGVYLNIFPVFASSLLALLFYKFYYLKKAESADGKGLRAISYIIVDAETFLLPILLITGNLVIGIM